MKKGLVLGKFMPFHKGHANLIKFAQKHCDYLIILICVSDKELISGAVRLEWLLGNYNKVSDIEVVMMEYNERDLPNTSVSSKRVSKIWANYLKEKIPSIDVVFSSEKYGDYLAEYLDCQHLIYDLNRLEVKISASEIRNKTFKYWDYLPKVVQPFFVKKVAVLGTESTGKSVLTEKLAGYFNTTFVPEMAREIIEHTEECKENHLLKIASLHAKTIIKKISDANKILFVDTDINITRSYNKFLFGKELEVAGWIEDANHFDLYLFLDKNVQYIQDGTRLSIERRNLLDNFHQKTLKSRNIKFHLIKGNWEERFEQSVQLIIKHLF